MLRTSTPRTFAPLIAALVAVITFGISVYAVWMFRRSSRENVRVALETVLAANVRALELWLDEERDMANQIAADVDLRNASLGVLDAFGTEASVEEHIAQVPKGAAMDGFAALTERADINGYVGWVLLDTSDRIVCSNKPPLMGLTLPLDAQTKQRFAGGIASITHPIRLPVRGRSSGGSATTSEAGLPEAAMLLVAPVRRDLQTVGLIALLVDPSRQFSEILSVAQMGRSGETYAFGRDAIMLSRSRFEADLRRLGLLANEQETPLNIQLRDPGQRIVGAVDAAAAPAHWPLTRMADSATREGAGADVVGYRNYRGVPVVGAWRWLPEYDFGIATELELEEAFAPLRILRNAIIALLATTLTACVALLGVTWMTRRRALRSEHQIGLTRRLGQYELRQAIGRGGMGTVYLGTHQLLKREVAVKVLENADVTERSLARFQREVRLSAQLTHPNTIEIYDFGNTDDGTLFYVMEFINGISLEQLVDHYGRQPSERVIYLLLQICGSIAEAHEAGMVHRDIKPANVLLTSRSGIHDLVKVLDFGLAKQLDQESMQLTRTEGLTGTPLFMSPESVRDASAADERSDVYAIGAIGYTLLCGKPPFDHACSADVCATKLHRVLPESPEHRIGIPLAADLQRVLMRCLHIDPERRPQSAKRLAAELIACADSPHWTQQDAALWWREVFDGPYPVDFETKDRGHSSGGTRGNTAVNDARPKPGVAAQSTVS